MSQLLSLGAFNKNTGEYVYPKIANKKEEYMCPECNKDLILCQGTKRVHHFRHKVDAINPCHYYNSPTETQIHKDAKMLLKSLLNGKIPISLIRTCCVCKKNEEFEIPETSDTSNIQIEYRFEFNGQKIADVAYIDDNQIICIFEICNTHKTFSENRPEPWFEIDAKTLIHIANNKNAPSIQIPCIRCEKCDDCIKQEKYKNSQIQKSIKKNTKYLIRGLDTENFIYLNVDFSKKDYVKELGALWDKEHKLWYISYNKYKKNKSCLDEFKIIWKCKECKDEEELCYDCWKKSVGWIETGC